MKNREYILRSINLYLACAIILAIFKGYTLIEFYVIQITDYIGQFGARAILFCLLLGIIAFYVYTFKQTRKYYFFSVPYLVLLTYFLFQSWYFGFIYFSDTFW